MPKKLTRIDLTEAERKWLLIAIKFVLEDGGSMPSSRYIDKVLLQAKLKIKHGIHYETEVKNGDLSKA